MRPRRTHRPAVACDAHEHIFASAGAPAFVHAYAEAAALPALSHACAERQQAWPCVALAPTRGGETGRGCRTRTLPPALASTGRLPNTSSAYKPPALGHARCSSASTALTRSLRGATPGARRATGCPLLWALRARKGPGLPRSAPMLAWCSCPCIPVPGPRPVTRFPPAGPQTTPPRPNARAHASANTTPRSPLERCCRAHPVRAADVSAPRRQAITRAVALRTDDGLIPPTPRLGPALVAPLRVPCGAMADGAHALAQRAQDQPASPWCDALPGAGPALLRASWGPLAHNGHVPPLSRHSKEMRVLRP
jgi:hypothetical protein